MRKILGLVMSLIVLVAIVSVAVAEDELVLPNGLKFGMSLSEASAVSGYTKGDRSEIHDAQMAVIGFDCDYLTGRATIGGHEAWIEVFFENNYLRQIRYNLASVDRKGSDSGVNEKIQASWDSVGDALIEKYGQPQETSHQFKNSFVEYSFGSGKNQRKETDYASPKQGFVVNVNGGSVYIDNYVVERMNSANTGSAWDLADTYYYQNHYLLYTFYDFQIDTNTEMNNSVDF